MVSSELLKHLDLVNDRVHQVLVLPVRGIVGVQGDGAVERLLRQVGLSEREVRLELSFVDPWKLCIESDTSLTIFDSFSVLLQMDITHRAIRQNLHSGLDVTCFSVQGDSCPVILPSEGLVALDLLRFSLRISCSFHHDYWLQIDD